MDVTEERSTLTISRYRELSVDDINSIKGLYILLIVIGHNFLVTSQIPGLFAFLYNFHVYGFLLLPFLFPAKEISKKTILNYSVRYLTPFFIFYLISSCLYFILYVKSQAPLQWLSDFFIGLVVNNAYWVKKVTGFQLFWFLPTLFSLVLIRAFLSKKPKKYRQYALLVMFLCHLFLGELPEWLKLNIPFGVGIVAYLYVLGELVSSWWGINVMKSFGFGFISLIVLGIFWFIGIDIELKTNLAWLEVASIFHCFDLLVHDCIVILSFISIVIFAKLLKNISIFVVCGKYSLKIYLIHSFVFYAQYWCIYPYIVDAVPVVKYTFALGSVIFTMAISVAISAFISNMEAINRFIFPSGVNDFWFFILSNKASREYRGRF